MNETKIGPDMNMDQPDVEPTTPPAVDKQTHNRLRNWFGEEQDDYMDGENVKS